MSGSTHAGEKFGISVAGQWLQILFAVEGQQFGDPFFRGRGHSRQQGEHLRFDIVTHIHDRDPPIRTWRDDKTPLESQLSDIVRSIFLRAEEDARDATIRQYRYQIEARVARIRDARVAAERAARERIARREANARERIQVLLDRADALEKAERIRRYVAAVQQRVAARSDGSYRRAFVLTHKRPQPPAWLRRTCGGAHSGARPAARAAGQDIGSTVSEAAALADWSA